jgi:hypothetical protein
MRAAIEVWWHRSSGALHLQRYIRQPEDPLLPSWQAVRVILVLRREHLWINRWFMRCMSPWVCYMAVGLTYFHVGAAGGARGEFVWTKAEEPKLTRRDRAEMEEFETRLEGDFISRDGLGEGVENLVQEDSGGDKLEGAKSQSVWGEGEGRQISKDAAKKLGLLGAGQADDSEFRVGVGQPTVFLTIALKRPLRLHIELSSQKSPEEQGAMTCLAASVCPRGCVHPSTPSPSPQPIFVDDLRSSQFPRDYPDVHEHSDSR